MSKENGLLSDQHYQMLHSESAINDEVIKRRGYATIKTSCEAVKLGFSHQQASTITNGSTALIIPYYNPNGSLATYCMRPDVSRSVDIKGKKKTPDGTYPQKVFKYEMIKGAGNVLDSHPSIIPSLGDPKTPLFFTEGAKKADCLISHGYHAINLNGVWGWRGTNKTQGKTALAGFNDIALNGRTCYLLFDNDVRTNDNVKQALRRFRAYLLTKKANVIPILLPPVNGDKTGIDDYLANENTVDDLEQLITYWTTFEVDLGGVAHKKWTTEDIKLWYADKSLNFAINDMSERLLINNVVMDDTQGAIIRTAMRDNDIPINHAEDTQVLLGNENRFHPIKEYFRTLKWDGQTDHIMLLASHFEDIQNVFWEWLKRWLIGAVAKIEGDGKNQNFMLVLDGPQGVGKSRFASWLCPLPDYFLESPIDAEDKDSQLRLMSNFVWEVGELGHIIRRADREAFKRFLTMQMVQVRRPYGHHDIIKPAAASFIGTVNNEGGGFLNDPTGSRRFAVTTLTSIDWDYSTDIDVNDVWAQAYALYQAGEQWELNGDDAQLRDKINAEYEQEEPLEDMVFSTFDIDPKMINDDVWRMTSPEILYELNLKQDDRSKTMRLASVLKKAGLKKSNPIKRKGMNTRLRYWEGIRVPSVADKNKKAAIIEGLN